MNGVVRQVVMSKVLSISLLLQLLLIACFIGLAWKADQEMDKSGIGDVDAWHSLNTFAGMAVYGAVFVWLVSVVLLVTGKVFRSTQAQFTIGLPPLVLILGWSLSWLI